MSVAEVFAPPPSYCIGRGGSKLFDQAYIALCVARTTPPDHTLFYTLSGQGKLTTPYQQYGLTPNTLAILPARQAFAVSIAAEHWDICWINLANPACWEHVALSEALVLENQQFEPLHLAMELLYTEPKPC
jgi:hypothetical protein